MSRTKPVDRLLRARQYVRDAAAERLELARRRLQGVLEEQALLTRQCRERVHAAGGEGESVTAAQLQTMADACKAAGNASCVCAEEMEIAREDALASYRQLRQVEILRERARKAEKVERRRKERKELDEIASRPGAKLVLPLLLVLAQGATVMGCQKEPPAPVAADTAVPKTDAGPPKAKKPKKNLDEDEMLLLRKLKERRGQLEKMKSEIDLREARLKLLQAKADKTLGEVKKIQGQIIKRVTGVAPAPPSPIKKIKPVSAPGAKPVKNLVDLNKVLGGMNTRAAAGMLAEVDPDIAARAIRHMTPKKASGVLAQMDPDRAALLAERLSRKEKRPVAKKAGEDKTRAKAKKPSTEEAATFKAPKKKKTKKRRRRRGKKKAAKKKAKAKMVTVEPETKAKKKPETKVKKKPETKAKKKPETKGSGSSK